MKVKFNKYERVAGLFVLTAIVGCVTTLVGVAVKRGWFEQKVMVETVFQSADGIHAGTVVQMSGLRAGSVDSVELKSNNEIRVQLEINKKFFDRVREDSVVRVMRPFIIGEKVLDISVGGEDAKPVLAFATLKSEESADIMDLMNGRKLGPYIAMIGQIGENLKVVAEAFLDPKRSKDIVKVLDEVRPLIMNASSLTKEANILVKQLAKESPDLGQDLGKISRNTAILTEELGKLVPMMGKMAPELPRASARMLELLDETVITLKAMQKSFLLSGKVKDVKEEERKREEERGRAPASDSD